MNVCAWASCGMCGRCTSGDGRSREDYEQELREERERFLAREQDEWEQKHRQPARLSSEG